MPLARPGRLNPMSLLATALVVAGLFAMIRGRTPAEMPASSEECDRSIDPLCAAVLDGGSQMLGGGFEAPVVPADEVCLNAGYLCAELELRGFVDVRRWKDHEGPVVVHVPLPDFESMGDARRLQSAAALGIRAWNGQPFPISVDMRGSRSAHFSVAWYRSMGGRQIGQARTQWSPETGLRVVQLDLVTRSPFTPGRVIDRRQIQLTAAHEMGHALGLLMHSDEERDVMFATNTATSLTSRDYRSMEALYQLEDGSRISR